MIFAIMIGRKGSRGLPGKNTIKVLGRSMCEYPLIAAKNSKYIKQIYVCTDCPKIKKISKKYKVKFIDRPPKLSTHSALAEDVFEYSYKDIKKKLKINKNDIESIVLIMANAPTITSTIIDKGINILRKNKKFDSAVSTSIYNMWSPLRARKLVRDGSLQPFINFKYFANPNSLTCDRDSQGDSYYADMAVAVVRPSCLEDIKNGLLPQKWMGSKIAPIKSWGGCDVDVKWQIPGVKYWLSKHGFKNKK